MAGHIDYAVSDSVTLRAEYIYDTFGDHRFVFQNSGDTYKDDVKFNTHTLRVGVAYRF